MQQPNRRKMRRQLGTRTTRRNGTKTPQARNERPKIRMKQLLAAYSRGEVDAAGRSI